MSRAKVKLAITSPAGLERRSMPFYADWRWSPG
jgi:hypothetical protein